MSHAQAGSFESLAAAGNAANEKIIAENVVTESAAEEHGARKSDAENVSGNIAVTGAEITLVKCAASEKFAGKAADKLSAEKVCGSDTFATTSKLHSKPC